jgi:hypothetical protein
MVRHRFFLGGRAHRNGSVGQQLALKKLLGGCISAKVRILDDVEGVVYCGPLTRYEDGNQRLRHAL